jgi:hypothetical protein
MLSYSWSNLSTLPCCTHPPTHPPTPPHLEQVLWAKGYTELLERLNEHTSRTGEKVEVDVYGSGPDLKVRVTHRGYGPGVYVRAWEGLSLVLSPSNRILCSWVCSAKLPCQA